MKWPNFHDFVKLTVFEKFIKILEIVNNLTVAAVATWLSYTKYYGKMEEKLFPTALSGSLRFLFSISYIFWSFLAPFFRILKIFEEKFTKNSQISIFFKKYHASKILINNTLCFQTNPIMKYNQNSSLIIDSQIWSKPNFLPEIDHCATPTTPIFFNRWW